MSCSIRIVLGVMIYDILLLGSCSVSLFYFLLLIFNKVKNIDKTFIIIMTNID